MPDFDAYEGDVGLPVVIGLPGVDLVGATALRIYGEHQKAGHKKYVWTATADTSGTPHKVAYTTVLGDLGPDGDLLLTAGWTEAGGRVRHSSDLEGGGQLRIRIGPTRK